MAHDRRSFLSFGIGTLVAGAIGPHGLTAQMRLEKGTALPALFPRQDPVAVEEMVRVAHFDLGRVKQLVEARPSLAKAAVDWGFGDWEDALGAASHSGRDDIAQLLIAHGARPTLFSATMMGQLDIVRAFVESAPGCQGIFGPHSITLLAHARAGGGRAIAVREYLERIGGADPQLAGKIALSESERAKYVGTYAFGASAEDVLNVASDKSGLSITRPGLPFPRGLTAVGRDEFVPMGAESVGVRFAFRSDGVTEVRVFDPDLVVAAERRSS
jgi:hypothetical protein